MIDTPVASRIITMKTVAGPLLRGRVLRAVLRMAPPWVLLPLLRADSSVRTIYPVVIFRVDDFPRWDRDFSEFKRFHKVFEQHRIPYVLGVTPWLEYEKGHPRPITGDEMTFLRTESNQGLVSIALHGFTHESCPYAGSVTEIAVYTKRELQHLIRRAEHWFQSNRLPFPHSFIPPFNSITRENLDVLSRWFRVILTGSMAISTLGAFKPQVFDETLYLPSYGPLYGSALRILQGLPLLLSLPQIHVVTLHWAWELASSLGTVERLLRTVKESFAVWSLDEAVERVLGPSGASIETEGSS